MCCLPVHMERLLFHSTLQVQHLGGVLNYSVFSMFALVSTTLKRHKAFRCLLKPHILYNYTSHSTSSYHVKQDVEIYKLSWYGSRAPVHCTIHL